MFFYFSTDTSVGSSFVFVTVVLKLDIYANDHTVSHFYTIVYKSEFIFFVLYTENVYYFLDKSFKFIFPQFLFLSNEKVLIVVRFA